MKKALMFIGIIVVLLITGCTDIEFKYKQVCEVCGYDNITAVDNRLFPDKFECDGEYIVDTSWESVYDKFDRNVGARLFVWCTHDNFEFTNIYVG